MDERLIAMFGQQARLNAEFQRMLKEIIDETRKAQTKLENIEKQLGLRKDQQS